MHRTRQLHPEALLYVATVVLCLLLLVPVFRIDRADLRVPMNPPGGDATFYQGIIIRPMLQQGWYLENPRLGAPDGLSLQDYPTGTDSLLYLMMKAIGLVARDSAVTLNLFFLLTFPLASVSMLFAARSLRLRRSTSVLVALLFAYLPYHLMRGEGHVALSAYFMLPLGLMVALRRGKILSPARDVSSLTEGNSSGASLLDDLRSRSFVVSCVASVALALSGVYYALFYIVMLLVVGIRRAIDRHSWPFLFLPVVLCGIVTLTVLLSNAPTFIYRARNGTNTVAAGHPIQDAEIYALRPVQLFVPITGHRIPAFYAAERAYKQFLGWLNPAFDNESRFASLGVLASIGFILLLAWPILGLRAPPDTSAALVHMGDLASINLAMLLLGTVGGFGYLIAYFLTPMFRGYNRVSIVIGMVALLALGMVLDVATRKFRGSLSRAPIVLAAALLVFGVFDQTSPWYVPDYAASKAANQIERTFAASAQKALPSNSMVFQLPFVTFPGADRPYPDGFGGYSLLIPYIYSDNLRWSFAAMRSRPTSDWHRAVAGMPVPEMIAELEEAGFSAVYVDSLGFDDGGSAISGELTVALGAPVAKSTDGRMLLWAIPGGSINGTVSAESTTTGTESVISASAPNKELQNTSFEQWSAGSPSGWLSSSTAAEAVVSQRFDWTKSGSSGVGLMDSGVDSTRATSVSQSITVTPGATYEVSVWVVTDRKPSCVKLGLRFLDATGRAQAEVWTSGDQWGVGTRAEMTRMVASAAAPSDSSLASVVLRLAGGPRSDGSQGLSSAVFDDVAIAVRR